MKPEERLEDIVRKDLDVRASDRTYGRMRDIILDAHESSKEITSAPSLMITRRTFMRSPIVKLGIAAAVIAVVGLGLLEFVGTGSKSGVVWAEVAQKVQACRGVIYRETGESNGDYVITYLSPTQYRSDGFKGGQLWMTMWDNRGTGKRVVLLHFQKGYVLEDMVMREEDNRKHADYQDPTWWVRQFVACQYTKLEPKEIDGTLCEGIETTDLALVGGHKSEHVTDSLVARLWVSTKTGYPVLFEGEFRGHETKDGTSRPYTNTTVIDQFQWDLELDPSVFEPNIPAGYEQM
jgi:hypothetical protein